MTSTYPNADVRSQIERLGQGPIFQAPRGDGGLVHVVGARPNFVKLSPVHAALKGMRQQIVHTGQHYDRRMSDAFFEALDIPKPDVNLAIRGGSHAEQTAHTMIALEQRFLAERPSALIVYGDVNSTLAATLVAAKLGIACIHVEAGLRSGDRNMPEEINRLVTDRLSDVLLTPSRDADRNLLDEGAAPESIFFVGNVMIDTLSRLLPRIEAHDLPVEDLPEQFVLVTLHRPSNVDASDQLQRILDALEQIAADIPIVFPVHPRTRARIEGLDRGPLSDKMRLIEPQDYLSFVGLQKRALAVITDSGGIQEETTWLGKPCLTLRTTTERPVTITEGTNRLLGEDPDGLRGALEEALSDEAKPSRVPEFWDGQAALRIRAILDALGLCEPA
ncbi:non-hydrolyzing UDP-N-acetylglucosamine 2-epimerase [Roseobacter sp. HKCCA0434]|uniref:non-hydrolyzing UDP-N-acetylglucosamine 2-epimerase n=1 Tax=Roseobacter sp. HKCCA0434 TaxID=3079297 RepID=UPI002905E2A0|nr:UDP-N-acetylglucosamine 2-epimerase (non-hydrolyzing) [Roseobacter sp. HKCCA0434]